MLNKIHTDTCSLPQITGKTTVEIGFNTHYTPPQDQREVKCRHKTKVSGQFCRSLNLRYISFHYPNTYETVPKWSWYCNCFLDMGPHFLSGLTLHTFSLTPSSCVILFSTHGSCVAIKCMACHWRVHAVLRVWTPQYSYVLKCVYVSVNFIQWEKKTVLQSIKHFAKYEHCGADSGRMRDPCTHKNTEPHTHTAS